MDKRSFLAAAVASGALPISAAARADADQPLGGPVLLTVTGAIAKPNRGPLDPMRDQMMAKQKLSFDKAHAFDFAALSRMPAVTIRPTIEYDNKPHELRGPLLATVLEAAGAKKDGKLTLRAIDGYAPSLPAAEALRNRFIVATHLDGKPLAVGGLGPLWAIYDADRVPEAAAKPVDQRFAMCPWGLYHVDVQG